GHERADPPRTVVPIPGTFGHSGRRALRRCLSGKQSGPGTGGWRSDDLLHRRTPLTIHTDICLHKGNREGEAMVTRVGPLTEVELRSLDAYWRAANYLTVGQIYLLDNPLLREPLRRGRVTPGPLGHWRPSPGPSLFYPPPHRPIVARAPTT